MRILGIRNVREKDNMRGADHKRNDGRGKEKRKL